jgi:ATP-dependent DNA ligase
LRRATAIASAHARRLTHSPGDHSDHVVASAYPPAGFITPCLSTKASTPPSGGLWIHEIKHDGFRVIARKDGARVRLRFPLIVEALARLRSRSCIIDGEAVCCDNNGRASFDRIRYRRHDASVTPST